MHHKWKGIIDILYKKQPMENYRGPTLNESPIELKDNSIS
jgi:hypothetical protein